VNLRIEKPSGGVRLLTVDRPERRNAIDLANYRALTAAIDDVYHQQEGGSSHLLSRLWDLDVVACRKLGAFCGGNGRRAPHSDSRLARPVCRF
jgi:hypothetical protein